MVGHDFTSGDVSDCDKDAVVRIRECFIHFFWPLYEGDSSPSNSRRSQKPKAGKIYGCLQQIAHPICFVLHSLPLDTHFGAQTQDGYMKMTMTLEKPKNLRSFVSLISPRPRGGAVRNGEEIFVRPSGAPKWKCLQHHMHDLCKSFPSQLGVLRLVPPARPFPAASKLVLPSLWIS